MSVKVMTWVWQHSRSKANARLVLLAIADCAADDGAHAYPSMAELIRKTGLSERTIQTMLTELTKLGELAVARNAGPRGCNRYRVRMTPADLAPPPQNLHPRNSRTPETTKPQVNPEDPAESAPPPQNPHPPQNLRHPPAESAPGTVLEPSESKKTSSSSSSEPASRPDVEQICDHLADRIETNGSKRPKITQRWRDSARLLLDRDHRTVDQVLRAIDWCQDDDFWRANILSMPKLREKYDHLRLAAQRPANGRASPNSHDIDWQAAMHRAQAREANP